MKTLVKTAPLSWYSILSFQGAEHTATISFGRSESKQYPDLTGYTEGVHETVVSVCKDACPHPLAFILGSVASLYLKKKKKKVF